MSNVDAKLIRELDSFQTLWEGGFGCAIFSNEDSEADNVADICIKPYINKKMVVLEIGCGAGRYTKRLREAKKIYCFDALSAEHNRFWERFEKNEYIVYHQVKDFKCHELPNDSIEYIFSYDTFCHISYSGADAYLKNLYCKLKKGANCFIMIADFVKYSCEEGKKSLARRAGFSSFEELVIDYDGEPRSGRWYFYNTQRFCKLLEKYGYIIVNRDVVSELNIMSPIIHFRKPE